MKIKVPTNKKNCSSGNRLTFVKSYSKDTRNLTEAISSDFKEHEFVENNNKLHGKSKVIFRSKN